jgi:hypothetical protein
MANNNFKLKLHLKGLKMKRFITAITIFSLSASSLAMDTVQYTKSMATLKKSVPISHDVVIDINYEMAKTCDAILSIDKIANEPVFVYLTAIRTQIKGDKLPSEYWSTINGIQCDNISAGLPKS